VRSFCLPTSQNPARLPNVFNIRFENASGISVHLPVIKGEHNTDETYFG